MLLEVGKAAAERVSARVDDLRTRQDQVDQADMHPVVGQLVDEERLVALALDAGAFEIFLAQRAQFVWLDTVQPALARADPGGECRDVGQFHRAFNLAVAGQDLLDQGRTRTRHADNEDRIGCGAPLPGAGSEERRGEYPDRAINLPGRVCGVIAQYRAAQAVALLIMGE